MSQKILGILLLSLQFSLVSCKQSAGSDSALQGTTAIGSQKVDLTTFKTTDKKLVEGMKKEMLANGFKYAELEAGISKVKIKGGITKDEAIALRLYTSAAYSKINTTLRSKQGSSISKLGNIVKVTSAGLNKLPSKSCTVRRGLDLPTPIVDKILKFKRFEEEAFMSTTTASSIPPAFQKNITFVIKSSKCSDISWLSEYPTEKEVLFPPGSEFTVVKSDLKKVGSVYKGTLNLKHETGKTGFKAFLSGAKQNIIALLTGVDKNDYPQPASSKKKLKKPAAGKTKLTDGIALSEGSGGLSLQGESEASDLDPMLVDWGVDTDVPDTFESAVDLSASMPQ